MQIMIGLHGIHRLNINTPTSRLDKTTPKNIPNITTIAPPSTGLGIVMNMAENFPNMPKSTYNTPTPINTCRLATYIIIYYYVLPCLVLYITCLQLSAVSSTTVLFSESRSDCSYFLATCFNLSIKNN